MDEEDDLEAARSLLAAGNKAEAFNRLIRAKAAGGDPARLGAIAAAMEQAGQHGSAVELWRVVVAAVPYDVAAHLAYLGARIASAGGDHSALTTIENELDVLVARRSQFTAPLWLTAADLYKWLHAAGKQRQAIKRAMAEAPASIEILRHVAHRYCDEGRRWRAWWVLQQLSRRTDLPDHLMGELSHLSRAAGAPNLGIRFARRLQALDRSNLDALVLEALAFKAKGKTRHAAQLVKARQTELSTLAGRGHLALQAASVLSAGGELEAERSLLTHAAAANPDNREIATALEAAQFGTWK